MTRLFGEDDVDFQNDDDDDPNTALDAALEPGADNEIIDTDHEPAQHLNQDDMVQVVPGLGPDLSPSRGGPSQPLGTGQFQTAIPPASEDDSQAKAAEPNAVDAVTHVGKKVFSPHELNQSGEDKEYFHPDKGHKFDVPKDANDHALTPDVEVTPDNTVKTIR